MADGELGGGQPREERSAERQYTCDVVTVNARGQVVARETRSVSVVAVDLGEGVVAGNLRALFKSTAALFSQGALLL